MRTKTRNWLVGVATIFAAIAAVAQAVTVTVPPGAGASSITTAQGLTLTGTDGSTTDLGAGGSLATGTCTLTLSDGVTSGGTVSATYVRSGKLVTVVCTMYSKGTSSFNATNQLRITGLPFAASTECAVVLYCPAVAYPIFGDITGSTSTVLLNKNNNAVDSAAFTLTAAGIAPGASLSIFGVISYVVP